MQQQEFFKKMLPYATKAASMIPGMMVSVILSQWAVESGWGESNLAKSSNNYGGVTYVQNVSIAVGNDGRFAKYASIDQFVQDYARVMNLHYYDSVRHASTSAGAVQALAASPYDAGHYNGNGESLENIIQGWGLTAYDTAAPAAPAAPAAVSTTDMAAIGAAFMGLLVLAGVSKK